MNYNNQVCPACGRVMSEGDDIVVCPVCATPQHRECWAENGKCANDALHGSGYVWERGKSAAEEPVYEEPDSIRICHICGSENPADIAHCGNCGALFSEQKKTEPESKKCSYCGKVNSDDALHCNQCGVPLGTNAAATAFFGGTPYIAGTNIPADEKIGENTAGDLAIYVRASAGRYIKKFKKFANGKKFSFNFAAFFFSPGWFFYRKLYKAGIFFLVAFVTTAILTSNQTEVINRSLNEYSSLAEKAYSEFYELYTKPDVTEEELNEKTNAITNIFTEHLRETWKAYLAVYGTNIALCLLCALMADRLYYKKAVEDLKIINESSHEIPVKRMMISQKGGLSVLGFIACSVGQGMLVNALYTVATMIKEMF